jgi:hypothetical protein
MLDALWCNEQHVAWCFMLCPSCLTNLMLLRHTVFFPASTAFGLHMHVKLIIYIYILLFLYRYTYPYTIRVLDCLAVVRYDSNDFYHATILGRREGALRGLVWVHAPRQAAPRGTPTPCRPCQQHWMQGEHGAGGRIRSESDTARWCKMVENGSRKEAASHWRRKLADAHLPTDKMQRKGSEFQRNTWQVAGLLEDCARGNRCILDRLFGDRDWLMNVQELQYMNKFAIRVTNVQSPPAVPSPSAHHSAEFNRSSDRTTTTCRLGLCQRRLSQSLPA